MVPCAVAAAGSQLCKHRQILQLLLKSVFSRHAPKYPHRLSAWEKNAGIFNLGGQDIKKKSTTSEE